MMNICHLITRLIVGGAQENTLLTCAGLKARGHRVTLLSGPETGPEGSLIDEARQHGFDIRIIDSLRRAIRPLADRRARRDIRAALVQIKPDIVHTHSSKAGILGRLAARDAGVPIVVHTIHGMSFNRTQSWYIRGLFRCLERHCGRFTDRIVSVADAMTRQAVAAGIAPAEKFVTVYSGMKTQWYDPAGYDRRAVRQSWGVADDEVVVLTIARLFRNKGYEQLIPAIARAAGRCPKLRFVWIGDGTNRDSYEHQLEALGIRSRVRLTGLVPPADVPPLLAGADMLVHASQWEGLPRAVVQALLMCRPAICFDIDGAPEVVLPNETGILVGLNDINALADAMIALAEDPARRERLGQAGRRLCLARFDHNTMVDQIEELYKKLAERRSQQPSASKPV